MPGKQQVKEKFVNDKGYYEISLARLKVQFVQFRAASESLDFCRL